MRKALFLDRDGVINKDFGYVYEAEKFVFKTEVFPVIRAFQAQGYKIIIVTNQSGIARGYYSERDFAKLSAWMCDTLLLHDIKIDDVLYCPHHPHEGNSVFTTACECRKPAPGMLLTAAVEHRLTLAESVMIGDKLSDVTAACKAGLSKVYWLQELTDDKTDQLVQYDQATQVIIVNHLSKILD